MQNTGAKQSFERLSQVTDVQPARKLKVFIPYDGSEVAEAALDNLRSAGLPDELEALVAVTNIWLPLSPADITKAVHARRMKLLTSGTSSFVPALQDHEEKRVLQLEVEQRLRSMFSEVSVRTEALGGTVVVAKEILQKAKNWGAELIILGSKFSPSPLITDFAGACFRVAHEAHCSVFIVRASVGKADRAPHVMVCVDEIATAVPALKTVSERSWPSGTAITILRVRRIGLRTAMSESEARALATLADELRAKGLKVSITTEYGQPHEVILQESRELAVDSIFIDAHAFHQDQNNGSKIGGLSRVAEALVLGAGCSIEVVRANDHYFKAAA